MYFGNPTTEDTHLVSFIQDYRTNEWSIVDYKVDEEERPIDLEVGEPLIPLVPGPENMTIEVPAVETKTTPHGESTTIPTLSRLGSPERPTVARASRTAFCWYSAIRARTAASYYAKNESNFVRQPVIGMDAAWVDMFVELAENPPYGSE